MKKLYILLFSFLMIISLLKSQVSITGSSMPQSGDTLRYSVGSMDTTLLLNYQNSGPNQTWNFDSIIPNSQGVTKFEASSQTPYWLFVQGKMGEKIADTISLGGFDLTNVYNFYNSNSSEHAVDRRAMSLAGLPIPIIAPFQDKDEVYQFPLQYGDRDSSTFSFTYGLTIPVTFYYSSSGYRINDVDAWGSLTTPYGTFSCIRTITDIVSSDSIDFNGTSLGFPNHQREYKWLSPNESLPILNISGNVIAGVFVPTLVRYRDSVRNVPSVLAPTALFNADSTDLTIGDTTSFNNLSISILPANLKWSVSPSTHAFVNGTNSNSTRPTVQFNDTGFYDVQLIARNSQGVDTLLRDDYIYVHPLSNSISEITFNKSFSVFPNPISKTQKLQIINKAKAIINKIEVIDLKGKIVYRKDTFKNYNNTLDLSNLNVGVYFVSIYTPSGIATKKLLIND